MESPEFCLRCNGCFEGPVDGICYRTRCQHFICEACACRSFSEGYQCPVCNSKLADGDIVEMTVGVKPTNLMENLFQTSFQSAKWEMIIENTFQALQSFAEISAFVHCQLIIEAKRNQSLSITSKHTAEEYRHEMNKALLQLRSQTSHNEQRQRELQHQLDGRDRELADLKSAYKEKMRKCQAWEKAYQTIREQLDGKPFQEEKERGGIGIGMATTPHSSIVTTRYDTTPMMLSRQSGGDREHEYPMNHSNGSNPFVSSGLNNSFIRQDPDTFPKSTRRTTEINTYSHILTHPEFTRQLQLDNNNNTFDNSNNINNLNLATNANGIRLYNRNSIENKDKDKTDFSSMMTTTNTTTRPSNTENALRNYSLIPQNNNTSSNSNNSGSGSRIAGPLFSLGSEPKSMSTNNSNRQKKFFDK